MDGQTDRQMDGRAIAYSALSMLSRAKKLYQNTTFNIFIDVLATAVAFLRIVLIPSIRH